MFLAGLICVCFGGCTAQRDLRLLAFGQDTVAEITLVQREQYEGEKHSHAVVEFKFEDRQGGQHLGKDRVSMKWERPADNTVTITYLPNSPRISELRGNWQLYHWSILIIGVGLLGGTYVTKHGYAYRADS